MSILQTVAWILIAFLSGALPFSVWVGRIVMGKDIRQFGDGNPGAFNVFRAGGKGWGWLAILLDGLKGAIPVGLANYWMGLTEWPLILVALAPILGHAFSPFLHFRGGKALAVTFGVWTGLTSWLAPVILGVFFAVFLTWFKNDRWAVFAGQLGLGVVLVSLGANWIWLTVWAGCTAIFILKYLPVRSC